MFSNKQSKILNNKHIVLFHAVVCLCFSGAVTAGSLRFYGNQANDIDRVKILIADTDTSAATAPPGPPLDVGNEDFTIEFWMRTTDGGPGITCSSDNSNFAAVILDRDRFSQPRSYIVSLTEGAIAFGVNSASGGSHTICSSTDLADDEWHHVAVQRRRSDGRMDI